jgi:hypothetical protein
LRQSYRTTKFQKFPKLKPASGTTMRSALRSRKMMARLTRLARRSSV